MYHINWTYFCIIIIIIIVITSFQFPKEACIRLLLFWYWGLKVLKSKYIPLLVLFYMLKFWGLNVIYFVLFILIEGMNEVCFSPTF